MSEWKAVGSSYKPDYEATYVGDRKKIADFVGGEGKVTSNVVSEYDKLFKNNYKFPVKFNFYKALSCVFIILLTCAVTLSIFVNDWMSLLGCLALIVLCVLAFSWVKYIAYPNETFPLVAIIFCAVCGTGVLVASYFYRTTIFSNLYFLDKALEKRAINWISYQKVYNTFSIFLYIAYALSLATIVIGILLGGRRFSSMTSSLVALTGFSMFVFLGNLAMKYERILNIFSSTIDQSQFNLVIFLLILAELALIIVDIGLIILMKVFAGRKSSYRRWY